MPTPPKKQLTLPATLVISVPFHPDEDVFCKSQRGPSQMVNQVLGQVAVKAANLLRGKEKAIYTPHVDTGDFVVVINAEKVRLTGKKEEQKSFMSFSGFVGGHKTENARARRARHPELLVERAIRGMIPHNKLGRAVYRKLKVYRGDLHPHAAQQPANVSLAS
jgi:large subunit ribosomal protein L13